MKLPTRRKEQIVFAFVLATSGRLPTDLDKLLAAMRESIPDLSEGEVRTALTWSLRRSRRLERKLRPVVWFGDDAVA